MTVPTGDDAAAEAPRVDEQERAVVRAEAPHPLLTVVDLSLGAGAVAFTVASRLAAATEVLVRPLFALVPRPPLPRIAQAPGSALAALTRHGTRTRVQAGTELDTASHELLPAVTDAVLDRIDITELVLTRVDLARVVEAVLDQIDLTELVIQRVDLDRVAAQLDVDAVAKRLDVDAVAARMDLIGIATYIVDAIDLPEIVRTSTGSVATEAVRGVRMQSVEADAQLQAVVDRVLLRRKGRKTQAPSDNGDGS